jgi:N-acylneuraminate cytidylyltransferase
MIVDAIILARGGSRGIPRKNIINFCGKPLIYWTISQCLSSKYIREVWVSSDSDEILKCAKDFGANPILRPNEIADHDVSSETSWLHAINYIEGKMGLADLILGPQVTSPLRESSDIDRAIDKFCKGSYDSMFSCSKAEDLFIWEESNNGKLNSSNYNYLSRKRRQDLPVQIIENGSFYLFKPDILKNHNNRLGGKIGFIEMDYWKMFEIDTWDDVKMCSSLMKEFLL